MGQNEAVFREALGQAVNLAQGIGRFSGIDVAHRLVGVDQHDGVFLPADFHDRGQALQVVFGNAGFIIGQFTDAGKPARQTAPGFLRRRGVVGIEAGQADQAVGMRRHGFHDIVVLAPEAIGLFPGKPEDHRAVDPFLVHGVDQFTGADHAGFGVAVKTVKGFLGRKTGAAILPDFGREDVGVEVDDHGVCSLGS